MKEFEEIGKFGQIKSFGEMRQAGQRDVPYAAKVCQNVPDAFDDVKFFVNLYVPGKKTWENADEILVSPAKPTKICRNLQEEKLARNLLNNKVK